MSQRNKRNFGRSSCFFFVCVFVCRCSLNPYESTGIKTHQEMGGWGVAVYRCCLSLTPMFGRQAIYKLSIKEKRPKLGTIKQSDFQCQCWGGSISAWHAISGKSKEALLLRQGRKHAGIDIFMNKYVCLHCYLLWFQREHERIFTWNYIICFMWKQKKIIVSLEPFNFLCLF